MLHRIIILIKCCVPGTTPRLRIWDATCPLTHLHKFFASIEGSPDGSVLTGVLKSKFYKENFDFTKPNSPMGNLRPPEIPTRIGVTEDAKKLYQPPHRLKDGIAVADLFGLSPVDKGLGYGKIELSRKASCDIPFPGKFR